MLAIGKALNRAVRAWNCRGLKHDSPDAAIYASAQCERKQTMLLGLLSMSKSTVIKCYKVIRKKINHFLQFIRRFSDKNKGIFMTIQKDNSCFKGEKIHKTKNNFKSMSSFLKEGSRGRKRKKHSSPSAPT